MAFDVALGGAPPVAGVMLWVSVGHGQAGHWGAGLFAWAWREWVAEWARCGKNTIDWRRNRDIVWLRAGLWHARSRARHGWAFAG